MQQQHNIEKYRFPSIEELNQKLEEEDIEDNFVIRKRADFHIIRSIVTNGYIVELGNQDHATVCFRKQNQIWMKLCHKSNERMNPFLCGKTSLACAQDLLAYGIDLAIAINPCLDECWILRDFKILGHTKNKNLSEAVMFKNFLNGLTPSGNQWHQQYDDGFMEISGNFFTYGKSKYSNEYRTKDGKICTFEPQSHITIQIGGQNHLRWFVKLKSDDILYQQGENFQVLQNSSEWSQFFLRVA